MPLANLPEPLAAQRWQTYALTPPLSLPLSGCSLRHGGDHLFFGGRLSMPMPATVATVASSTSSATAAKSTAATTGALRTIGVRSVLPVVGGGSDDGLAACLPATARASFSLMRADVRADGHCGAHVLALVLYALTRRAHSSATVRARLFELECGVVDATLDQAHRREFRRTFATVLRDAFLNDADLVLFLHALRLGVHILTWTNGRLMVHTHPLRPLHQCAGVVFLLFSHGCHWELLARSRSHTRGQTERRRGFSPVWSRRAADAFLTHIPKARIRVGEDPKARLTTFIDGTPLFRIDATDRLWIRKPGT